MRTERDVMTTTTVTDYICDVCKEKITSLLTTGGADVYSCFACERDLCRNCVRRDDRGTGDFPEKYCASCWTGGKPWHEKQLYLENACYDQVQDLEDAWYREAKAKVEAESKR